MADRVVDARGMSCPRPVLETRKALSDEALASLEVLVDNSASAENVSRMARSMGCEVRLEDRDGGDLAVLLERAGGQQGGGAAGPPEEVAEEGAACAVPSNLSVLVATETVGRGSDDLGRLLMVAFVKTLAEVVPRPRSLVLMNGGVKLAVEGSELIDAIRRLEGKGIDVLVCGTCLDFFGLSDDLKVGRVSNMFEIASTLAAADRLVRP